VNDVRPRTTLAALGTSLLLSTTAVAAFAPAASAATPTLTVSSTQALPNVVQNAHVVGRDNGQSAPYQGKSVWIFDDTILRNPDGFLTNSGAITSDLNGADGITLKSDNPFTDTSADEAGTPSEIIPLTAAEKAFQSAHAQPPCTTDTDPYCGTVYGFWPGPVVADPARHRIIFSYGKLCRGGADGSPCASGFIGVPIGTGFAQLDMNTRTVTRIKVQNPDPSITSPELTGPDDTMMWPPDGTKTWGGGQMLIQGDTLYAWGGCTAQTNICGVAKVPVGQLQNRLAWRFYTGTSNGQPVWSANPADAVSVGEIDGAAGGTVQYVPALHGYLNTYMAGISGVAVFQTAPNPWGPWTDPKTMFTGDPTNTLWDYAMFAHPEYATDGGLTQYITYYNPQTTQQELVRVNFAVH
jgi:hypothetical protein